MIEYFVGGAVLLGLGWLLTRSSGSTTSNSGITKPTLPPANPPIPTPLNPYVPISMSNSPPNSGISDWLPPSAGPARENAILQRVKSNEIDLPIWAKVTSTVGKDTAEFTVLSDALKLAGVRVNVNAITNQKIADSLDCMMLTAKIADLMWAQKQTKLLPLPAASDDSTAAMIAHSLRIDKKLRELYGEGPYGLIDSVGKLWLIDNRLATSPGMAMNYGWPFDGSNYQGISGEPAGSGTWKVIQGRGTAHNDKFTDYSQVCRLVRADCLLNGEKVKLDWLLSQPEYAALGNYSGVLKVLRQPGV